MASILNPYVSEANKNVALGNGAIMGWDRSPKRLWPTLTRGEESVAWGFSIICGQDILESAGRWSGVATRRNERGLWLKVRTVRDDTPAAAAGLTDSDFITRINGRIVFHMSPQEAERLIKNSGTILYLDVERNPSRRLIYDDGKHQNVSNFLFTDHINDKHNLLCRMLNE